MTAKEIINEILSKQDAVTLEMLKMQYGGENMSRSNAVVKVRDECFYEIRKQLGYSHQRIGNIFNRHSSTVLQGIRRHLTRCINV